MEEDCVRREKERDGLGNTPTDRARMEDSYKYGLEEIRSNTDRR
jgi:hypothetical protein